MGQLERYGLYVLCLVIFLILGVAIWGGDPVAASPLPVVIFSDEDGEEMVLGGPRAPAPPPPGPSPSPTLSCLDGTTTPSSSSTPTAPG